MAVRVVLVIATLILSLSPTKAAEDIRDTVQGLYQDCQAPNPSWRKTVCVNYIAGVADTLALIGKVEKQPENAVCAADATYGAMIQSFKNWAEQNPREWAMPKIVGVMLSLERTWPCKPSQ